MPFFEGACACTSDYLQLQHRVVGCVVRASESVQAAHCTTSEVVFHERGRAGRVHDLCQDADKLLPDDAGKHQDARGDEPTAVAARAAGAADSIVRFFDDVHRARDRHGLRELRSHEHVLREHAQDGPGDRVHADHRGDVRCFAVHGDDRDDIVRFDHEGLIHHLELRDVRDGDHLAPEWIVDVHASAAGHAAEQGHGDPIAKPRVPRRDRTAPRGRRPRTHQTGAPRRK